MACNRESLIRGGRVETRQKKKKKDRAMDAAVGALNFCFADVMF